MRKLVPIAAGLIGLLAGTSMPAWAQAPKTCSDAHADCYSRTKMTRECEAEKQWCMKTGTFADPKTKSVFSGLRKK